jgi:DNA-binding response OmpR family regulator
MNPKIAVIEDDEVILRGLQDNLRFEGYEPVSARDAETGYKVVKEQGPELIILDVMLPRMNGYELCRKLRKESIATPILMLTARGQEIDCVMGLDLGADDYVVKPFLLSELMARVRALLRRTQPPARALPDHLQVNNVKIDFQRYEARKSGRPLPMTRKEFSVLRLLASRGGAAMTRDELLNEAWGYEHYPSTRTVDNHIASLRIKLETNAERPKHLLTVHGVGYRLVI